MASYRWNTSGLTDATAITGASTADLKFQWNASNATAAGNSATLTVTNTSGKTQVQTYTFQVPAGSGTAGTGTLAWPQVVSPDAVSASAPTMAVQDGAIDANSGAFDTAIALPSYDPNVPSVTLAYDSVTANPQPILDLHHTLDPAQATPSQVTAQLTFNGSAGSTVYTNTSQLIPGDVQQIALQANASGLASGRYGYSVTTGDVRSSTTTATATGSTDVINNTASALGSGWTVAGLEKIIPASGGVVLDLGEGGKSLWFATGSGSTYVDPAGEFSTLVANSGGTTTRTLPNGLTIQFNSAGQEISALDPNGIGDNYTYNANNSINTIKDNYGNTTTFAYTAGLLASITDPASRVASFTHNGTNLSGVTLPDNSSWTYGYSGTNALSAIKDPNSNNFGVTYDAAGRVSGVTNPDSTTESFSNVQESGLPAAGTGTSSSPAAPTLLAEAGASMTDQVGDVSSIQTDWAGLGLSDVSIDALGNISTANRDGNGLPIVTTDPMNRITQSVFDAKANVTKTTYPDGTTSSATYNSFAEPLTTTNRLGYGASYVYDTTSDKTSYTDEVGNVTTWTYSGGLVTSQTLPPLPSAPSGGGGPQANIAVLQTDEVSNTGYNTQGEGTTSNTNGSQAMTYTFNAAGMKTSQTNPKGDTQLWTYDAMNRLLSYTDGNNNKTTYTRDPDGNVTIVTDPLLNKTTTAFNPMGLPTTVTAANNGVTTTGYDKAGRVTSITDPDNNKTSYTLNADGWRMVTTDPFSHATTLTRDADGEVTSSTDRDGRLIRYGYNAMGQVTSEQWINSGGATINTVASTYDNGGELTKLQDNSSTLTYTYDKDGNALTVSTAGTAGQPSVTLTSTYAGGSFVTGLADNLSSAGSVSYYYDAAQRLTQISTTYGGTAGPRVAFGYDTNNNLTTESRTIGGTGTAVATTLGYDTGNRLTSIAHAVTGGATLDSYTYGYDAAGRLTSETNAEGSVTDSYDTVNELTGVTGSQTATYGYDLNGNRNTAGYTTGTNNQLTAGAGNTYTYDAEQNLLTKTQTSTGNVWTYTWDYRNRLTGVVEKSSSGTVLVQGTYTYDALNRRIGVAETVGGTTTTTWTVYNGTNPYADFNGSGTLLTRYLTGKATDSYLARVAASGTVAWYLADHEGSIRDIANTSGAVIDHVAYDSYGNVTSETSPSNGDRIKFDGMAWDAAIGDYYDNARYYDSVSGRFISQDSFGFQAGDTNLDRFVGNSPSDYVDPTGHDLKDLVPGRVRFDDSLAGTGPITVKPENGPNQDLPTPNPIPGIPNFGNPSYPVDGVFLPTGVLKIPNLTVGTLGRDGKGRYYLDWSGPNEPLWYPSNGPNNGQNPFGNNPATPGTTEQQGPPPGKKPNDQPGRIRRKYLQTM